MQISDTRLSSRFWSLASPTATGCWVWSGLLDGSGYGMFKHKSRNRGSHRLAYEDQVGLVPEGLELDHLCRVRICVNPAHLEPVTHAENIRRRYADYTHCKNGHEFTVANTYIRPSGQRDCRSCIRARALRYYHRKAGAA